MIYDIRHVTTYRYDAPVTSARCTLRLLPSALTHLTRRRRRPCRLPLPPPRYSGTRLQALHPRRRRPN